MREKFAESDLLALIEGELQPKQAADLRRRLAGDKRLLSLVERLQDDREVLRSMEQPRVPDDLLAELEPMMARPMLMPDSGDWRQRYRKRRPWRRYLAVAAVVCMALLAGVWAATSGLLGGGVVPDGSLATDAAADPAETAVALAETMPDEPWPPADTTVHHRGPVGDAVRIAAADAAPRPAPGPRRARGAAPMLTAADFVLVVRAGDDGEQAVQQALQRVLGRLDDDAALTRNFSFQEAERLARRLETDQGRRLDRELAMARDDFAGIAATDRAATGERLVKRRRAAGRLARTLEQSGGELAASGQLLGPKSLAPSYEQQLEYSEGGATWTITVPAERLNEVLAQLQLTEGRATVLQLRGDGAAAGTVADRWLSDYTRIQREAAQLQGTVMVPVVVEE